jgi:LmbE family N-acetylglucosaminyl deacetylase
VTAPVRNLNGAGTPEEVWLAADKPAGLPVAEPGSLVAGGRVVVLAPHPDDEILGAGGTLALLTAGTTAIHLLAVTDGEASRRAERDKLRHIRARERDTALHRLGLTDISMDRLGLPDSAVTADAVANRVTPLLRAGDILLAPWRYDGHPDHDACGEAALLLPVPRLFYLVWAWHWAQPTDIPWELASQVLLGGAVTARKREAIAAFTSQVQGERPILPEHVLRRLTRPAEVFLRDAA